MMSFRFRHLNLVIIALLTFIGSCIDPLDIDIDRDVNILVVEGSISTLPGPYFIRLSRSAKFGSVLEGPILPVNNAILTIRDSDGNNYPLSENIFTFYDPVDRHTHSNLTGVYSTSPDFLPEVGKSYSLLIVTVDGTQYTSLPEKIIPAPELQGLSAVFSKTERVINKDIQVVVEGPIENDKFRIGLEVFASFQDAPGEQNFYMWKSNGTYQTTTFPAGYRYRPGLGGPPIFAPKDCCSICWVNESSADGSIRLLSDQNVNGNVVTSLAAFVEDDGYRFSDKYFIRVEQHSLTKNAFQFFQLLQSQISISGNIFDPPPATIRGNMINLTDPNENVIGYFRASDVSLDSIFLTRDMLLEVRTLPEILDDCRTYRNGIAEKPSYW